MLQSSTRVDGEKLLGLLLLGGAHLIFEKLAVEGMLPFVSHIHKSALHQSEIPQERPGNGNGVLTMDMSVGLLPYLAA